MIRATGLGRRFGALWAIRDMDLEVRRGEVLGLLGPNGAGKTTTVRVLTSLIEPSEGRATVDGFDVVAEPEAVRARVGILTETPGLYEKLSATANLDFFGRLYGLDASTRAERIERYLRLFSLWERRDEPAGTFSKGMKQKLAIARALLHEPAVVFLDEPTAALDPEAAFIVREAIEGLRRSGRTIVLATHTLDEANRHQRGLTSGSVRTRPGIVPSRAWRRHPNSRLRLMPCRSATPATDEPGRIASSTSASFCSVLQRRRRCTTLITSPR